MHGIQQFLIAKRLGQKLDGAGFHRAHRRADVRVAGNKNNRNVELCLDELPLKIRAAETVKRWTRRPGGAGNWTLLLAGVPRARREPGPGPSTRACWDMACGRRPTDARPGPRVTSCCARDRPRAGLFQIPATAGQRPAELAALHPGGRSGGAGREGDRAWGTRSARTFARIAETERS